MTRQEINSKAKWVLLFLISSYILCNIAFCQKPSNANYYELSFKINTPYKYGETITITGTVVKKHKTSNNGITDYFITLVKNNSTFRVKVLEKPVYALVEQRQNLTLRNCVILKLKQ